MVYIPLPEAGTPLLPLPPKTGLNTAALNMELPDSFASNIQEVPKVYAQPEVQLFFSKCYVYGLDQGKRLRAACSSNQPYTPVLLFEPRLSKLERIILSSAYILGLERGAIEIE